MTIFKRLILIFSFMTRLYIPIKFEINKKDIGKSLAFSPIVGLFIGLILFFINFILKNNSPLLNSVIIFALYVVITGGLHIDGLGDTFDGIFSNKPKEKMLEIMKDSRIGTFGLLAVVFLVLINFTSIFSINASILGKVLIVFPILGRMAETCSASFSKYARKEEGLGSPFIDNCGLVEAIISISIGLIISFLLFSYYGIFLSLISVLFAFLFVKYIERKIGGMTGDTCGACLEICQALILFIFALGGYNGWIIFS